MDRNVYEKRNRGRIGQGGGKKGKGRVKVSTVLIILLIPL